MTVSILHGDALAVLVEMEAESCHACVTDPPYHLTSIVKRFGSENAAPATSNGATGVYARSSKGFMGKTWDGGDVAFQAETWAAVHRVLKPGAHLLAFGGTRTFHRLACAIEDAGFEIRDTIMWLYGSGFPKSHDVSKAIDRRPGVERHAEFAADLRAAMTAKGYTNTFDVAERIVGRRTGAVANWQKYQWPEAKWWPSLRDLLGMNPKWDAVIAEAERERLGQYDGDMGGLGGQRLGRANGDITAPATEAARQWQGWGTALKPACEPIVVARKPLSEGTVAANVLCHGTGALNIDACRVATRELVGWNGSARRKPLNGDQRTGASLGLYEPGDKGEARPSPARWPPNVCHDGSPEVLEAFARFGESKAGTAVMRNRDGEVHNQVYGDYRKPAGPDLTFGDTGTAARFFFCAKADASERVGSHPTVKPVALMEWLVRLVTPPGGRVLDCFCGTGSTLVACDRLGFDAIGIEQDAQTVAGAHEKIRRMRARRMIGDAERVPVPEAQLGLGL